MKRSTILLIQGIYYVVTGIWPIVSIDTFMQVTGYKTDVWLVKMVGLLTASIAITLLFSYKKAPKEILVLAICSAISYTAIDVYYYLNDVIGAVYLADAVVEVLIILALVFSGRKSPTSPHK